MKDIQREILNDLPTQRFQENVSRAFKKQFNDIGNRVESLEKTNSSYIDLEFTYSSSGVQTKAHNLGKIPTGWQLIDAYIGGSSATIVYPTRTSWDENNISIYFSSGSTVTLKIRVFL